MFIIRYLHTLLLLMLLLSYPLAQASTAMPNVVGLSLEAAKKGLDNQGLSNYSVQYQPTTHHPADKVMVQAPPPNTKIAPEFHIRLIISKSLTHLKTSLVPNLKGMSLEEAKVALAAVNLQLGHVGERSTKMERIQVLYQTPKSNQRIIQQRAVNITLSDIIDQDTPRVKLIFDKIHFKVGESTWIQTKTYNVNPDKKAEYGFSINGRTYYSSKPKFQYTFKRAGHYIITASFRYARGTWYASHTRKVKAFTSGSVVKETKPVSNPERVPESAPIVSKPTPAITTKKDPETATITPKESLVNVPNVIGLSQVEAQKIMKKAKLQTALVKKPHKTKQDVILSQSPKANKQVKANTPVTLTLAEKIKPWLKPKAVINPIELEVIQGKTALFSSHSTHDKRSKLLRHWSTKLSPKTSMGRSFKINTQALKAGRYRIKLTIKDNKALGDTTSALLIVKEKEIAKEKAKLLSNPQLYGALFNEVSHYKVGTSSPYLNTLLTEANLLQPLKYPQPNIAYNEEGQALLYPSTPAINPAGIELSYIHALLLEAKQTIDQLKPAALSETLMSPSLLSNKISSSKAQQVQNDAGKSPETPLITVHQTSIVSWHLWIWLGLILTTCLALISIIWSYQGKKKIETLNIVYQYQNDEGKQRIVRKSS